MKKYLRTIKTSTLIQLLTGLAFLILGALLVVLIIHQVQENTLREAEEKANIILYRNLATHTYFSHQLKPAVFELTGDYLEEEYFDPRWMSSTYAVREIEKIFPDTAEYEGYSYKEAAINARNPENEADDFERQFLEALNADPQLTSDNAVRMIDGKPYFITMIRGEVIEEACLRCHSQPDVAPAGLIEAYGSERGFGRQVGETISAISIRVPLASAIRDTSIFIFWLGALLLFSLLVLILFPYLLNHRLLYHPMEIIRQKAQRIASGDEKLGEQITMPFGRELVELTTAFNSMSESLRQEKEQLEKRVVERTTEILEQKQYYEALVVNNPIAIVSLDMNHKVVAVNPAFEKLFEFSESEVAGRDIDNLIAPAEGREKAGGYTDRVLGGEIIFGTGKRCKKDGSLVEVEIYGVPVLVEGEQIGLLGLYNDVTERSRAELALQESEDRFRGFFELAAIGLVITTLDGTFTQVNQAMAEIVGYTEEELLTMSFEDITHPEDLDIDLYYVESLLNDQIKSFKIEKRYIHKQGYVIWVSLNAALVRDSNGNPDHFIGQIQDIISRKHAEQRLQHMATHDPLTDLPNRSLFYDRLNHALQLAIRLGQRVAVMFLDLDGFKEVNDSYGHEKGDMLLKMVAERFQSNLRESDSVARLGGDEFAFVFENIKGFQDAGAAAVRVLESLSKPIKINHDQCSISASIGISLSPGDGEDAETLVKTADAAMYRAKEHGMNSYQFYSDDL